MTVSFVGVGTSGKAPTGLQQGDLLLAILEYSSLTPAPTVPSGWRQLGSAVGGGGEQFACWTKNAMASDSGTTVISPGYVGDVVAYRAAGRPTQNSGSFAATIKTDSLSGGSDTFSLPALTVPEPVPVIALFITSEQGTTSSAFTSGWTADVVLTNALFSGNGCVAAIHSNGLISGSITPTVTYHITEASESSGYWWGQIVAVTGETRGLGMLV